ncbi:MAG: PBP1A family penicillin-binding protein [Vicinamibacterales bacterium]
MNLARLKPASWKDWLRVLVGGALIAFLVLAGVWTARHAWAIYGLKQGIGETVFYDADGKPWFGLDELRRDVPFDQVSTYFKDAVISVEDHRFYLHPGIDPVALARATLYNIRDEGGTQGGSTLTQQLARTLYLSNQRTLGRKAKEAVLAVLLEVVLSKREILELYFNRVYLSAGIYGVESMSQKMLRKSAAKLSLAESALIAGIIRAPASYSPWTHFDAARRRSFVVLQRMREEGKITPEQEQAARAESIRISEPPAVSGARQGYAKEWLRQQFREIYGGDNPPDWQVHTTFVPSVQDAAEAAVREGLRRVGTPGLQAALVAIDPSTGNILAMVGGSDFKITPFNRAARSRRQSGSAFKPFLYAAALESGLSPVSTIQGLTSVAIQASEGVWIPRDERASGEDAMALRDALARSSNAAAVILQQRIGTDPVLKVATSAGVRNQPRVPSLALGTGLVSPLDLTAAYAVFPNGGFRVRPRGLVDVRDADNSVVERIHIEREQVISAPTAFQMVSMLQDVVDRGTGAAARRLGVRGAIGGKTGTTNDYRDAWFVGFSSAVVVGVWVGFDQPERIRDGGSGAQVALPIWADFMKRTATRLPATSFARPGGLESVTLCRLSHARPVDGCPTYTEYFKSGDEIPNALCDLHKGSIQQRAERAIKSFFGALGRSVSNIFK